MSFRFFGIYIWIKSYSRLGSKLAHVVPQRLSESPVTGRRGLSWVVIRWVTVIVFGCYVPNTHEITLDHVQNPPVVIRSPTQILTCLHWFLRTATKKSGHIFLFPCRFLAVHQLLSGAALGSLPEGGDCAGWRRGGWRTSMELLPQLQSAAAARGASYTHHQGR